MNLPIIASKYPPKNRKVVWLQLDDNGGIKSIRKASNNGGFNTLTKTNGITYNEELNSIAIGNETVVNGQNQFVFGRYNELDADKVEIVGGGEKNVKIGDKIILTIKDSVNQNSYYYSNVEATCIGNRAEAIEYIKSLSYSDIDKITALGGSTQRDSIDDNFQIYGIPDEATFFVINAEPVRFKSLLIAFLSKKPIEGDSVYHVTSMFGDTSTLFNITMGAKTVVSFISISDNKNIRTLDWQGNQWNAGDITCDDGNGNTISLRALAQQIASLSTATTSNES